jgi:hypothetical protein
MISISWYTVILVSIPESLLMVLMGFQLYNLKVKFGDAFLIAVISAITSFYVRKLPIVFGVHSLIGIAVLIALCWFFTRLPLYKVIWSVLTGFAVMAVTQSIVLPLGLLLTSIDYELIKNNAEINSLFFLIQAIIVVALLFFCKVRRFYIFDLSDGDQNANQQTDNRNFDDII